MQLDECQVDAWGGGAQYTAALVEQGQEGRRGKAAFKASGRRQPRLWLQ